MYGVNHRVDEAWMPLSRATARPSATAVFNISNSCGWRTVTPIGARVTDVMPANTESRTNPLALTAYRSREPGPSQTPVPHDRLRRNVEYFSRFLDAEAAEIAQLDHLSAARVDRRQRAQRIVKRAQFSGPLRLWRDERIEIDILRMFLADPSTATFRRRSFPGRVHEDLSHHASSDGIKVRSIPEIRIVAGRQP